MVSWCFTSENSWCRHGVVYHICAVEIRRTFQYSNITSPKDDGMISWIILYILFGAEYLTNVVGETQFGMVFQHC